MLLAIRLLYAISALLFAAGVAAWLVPTREPGMGAPRRGAAPDRRAPAVGTGAATSALGGESFTLVVDSNVFSPERAAPPVRFTLAPAAETVSAPVRRAPLGPRVFGITIRSGDPSALIDADPLIPGAEIYRVGDNIGTALIVEISDSTVILEGPAGRRVLRLERRAKP